MICAIAVRFLRAASARASGGTAGGSGALGTSTDHEGARDIEWTSRRCRGRVACWLATARPGARATVRTISTGCFDAVGPAPPLGHVREERHERCGERVLRSPSTVPQTSPSPAGGPPMANGVSETSDIDALAASLLRGIGRPCRLRGRRPGSGRAVRRDWLPFLIGAGFEQRDGITPRRSTADGCRFKSRAGFGLCALFVAPGLER